MGFGDLNGDFWLGNDNLYRLTNGRLNVMYLKIKNEKRFCEETYSGFNITDEDGKYAIYMGIPVKSNCGEYSTL